MRKRVREGGVGGGGGLAGAGGRVEGVEEGGCARLLWGSDHALWLGCLHCRSLGVVPRVPHPPPHHHHHHTHTDTSFPIVATCAEPAPANSISLTFSPAPPTLLGRRVPHQRVRPQACGVGHAGGLGGAEQAVQQQQRVDDTGGGGWVACWAELVRATTVRGGS